MDYEHNMPTTAGHDGPERRGFARRKAYKGATATFNRGYGAFECVVRDRSEGGARLGLGDTSVVPPSFELKVSDEPTGRVAHVRWRTMTAVGVQFEAG